ncbi:MAG TPA: pantoate--beta-alanine ligase, partial [Deltaproteobacteria bacterium]|nr:pantoate--beta-alanine ligase [Deltaproteobacteria bacterium]
MRLITNIQEMRLFSSDVKKSGKTIVFVPTMGYLHDGHG